MISSSKLKAVDFYRKIPRDLTEASLSGAGLSIIAALSMVFLFGMELNDYMTVNTSTAVVVDRSPDGEFLRIDFNISFPSLSCEFASVDVSDILGTNRLNITKTVRKFSIDPNLKPTGSEYHPGPIPTVSKHGDEFEEESGDGSVLITTASFDQYAHQYAILVVNFYAPWCYWSNRLLFFAMLNAKVDILYVSCIINTMTNIEMKIVSLVERAVHIHKSLATVIAQHIKITFCQRKGVFRRGHRPSWERTAKVIRERYDPEVDKRILMGKVDCTEQITLCKRHHIQGYPSIRIFRKGSDVRDDHGHHDHESYYGERDTDSLVAAMETLVASIPKVFHEQAFEDKSQVQNDSVKRPAPSTSGCRVEGFVRVKKVPGNLIISAHSGAHSFDASIMNVSHVISHFSFGKKLSPKMHSEIKRLTPHLGGSHDRLADKSYIISHDDNKANVTIEHYLQLVKTEIVTRKSSKELKLFEEYEYTAHSSLVHSLDIPVSKFHFEPSPMQVLITEIPKSFSHFITNLCAITGGVFTVAGILDSILHNTMRFVKKVELGKQF